MRQDKIPRPPTGGFEEAMSRHFCNVYDDKARASSHAELELPGTYYLAYRGLPAILRQHAHGSAALDFGCGAGRSTRFLRDLGFDVVGLDISEPMLTRARQRGPAGTYLPVSDGDLTGLAASTYDLILAAFTYDYVPWNIIQHQNGENPAKEAKSSCVGIENPLLPLAPAKPDEVLPGIVFPQTRRPVLTSSY
jgi:SAM-dependent methyltransferase